MVLPRPFFPRAPPRGNQQIRRSFRRLCSKILGLWFSTLQANNQLGHLFESLPGPGAHGVGIYGSGAQCCVCLATHAGDGAAVVPADPRQGPRMRDTESWRWASALGRLPLSPLRAPLLAFGKWNCSHASEAQGPGGERGRRPTPRALAGDSRGTLCGWSP